MPLPPELEAEPADTTVIGDVDDFIAYVENGQALLDWQKRMDMRRKEFEELFACTTMAA